MDAHADALAANGFFPRSLRVKEARGLHGAWYPCPPDTRAGHNHTIGVSNVPIPDVPRQSDASWPRDIEDLYYNSLSPAQRNAPEWNPYNPANYERYCTEFRRRHREEFNRWDGPGPFPRDRNVAGRRAFWSVPGRTLQSVLAHIEVGDTPRLETPAPPPPPPTNRWAPRRSTTQVSSSSSRSSSSSFSARSAPSAYRVYDNAGALIINNSGLPIRSTTERPLPSPPKRVKMDVKTEAPAGLLAELIAFQQAHADDGDDAAFHLAVEASKDTIPSLDNHLAITGTPVFDVDSDNDDGGLALGANQDETGPSNYRRR